MSLAPAFEFSVGCTIKPGQACIGKCEYTYLLVCSLTSIDTLFASNNCLIIPCVVDGLVADDGVHPCLTVATSGGKVMIHDPHSQQFDHSSGGASQNGMRTLNIQRKVRSSADTTCLSTARKHFKTQTS